MLHRSVIGRLLQSSDWPDLLRVDSAASEHVVWPARFCRGARLLATLLIPLVAIVTPLGLHDTVAPSDNPTNETFHYVVDRGIFGYNTPSGIGSLPWSRVCSSSTEAVSCPSFNASIGTGVTRETLRLFSSVLSSLSGSISSIFDIKWRSGASWEQGADGTISLVHPVGTFHHIDTVALNGNIKAIEGLLVESVYGGIGFRNHSAPPVRPYGST